jgi:hypothetical protein
MRPLFLTRCVFEDRSTVPATVLHLVAVERLARDPRGLPADVARALAEDLEYARFGAALPDLPYYGHLGGELASLVFGRAPGMPPFARLLHTAAPVAVGLKMAELVSRGALVGREPGIAAVIGYFTHLALDRQLHPIVETLLERWRRAGETVSTAHRRIEWVEALFWLRETLGRELVGTSDFSARCRVLKRRGLPVRGIGRGLYELVRSACADVLGPAPSKADLDTWVRGLYVYGKVMGSPLGRRAALPRDASQEYRTLYRGERLDVGAAIETALDRARSYGAKVGALIARGDFSPRARGRFLAELPEGSLLCAA